MPDAMEQGEVDEADLRIKRAIFELRRGLGSGLLDIGNVLRILEGRAA